VCRAAPQAARLAVGGRLREALEAHAEALGGAAPPAFAAALRAVLGVGLRL
jgi:hypothetical protein